MVININNLQEVRGKLNINGNEETDPAILSRTFNSFFLTIAQKIESKLTHNTKHYTDHLTEPTANKFILTTTNTEGTEDIIKTLNIPKSIGPNSILTRLLKEFLRKSVYQSKK